MFVYEKRRISVFFVVSLITSCAADAAPSVRQWTDSGVSTTTYSNPTTVRSGTVPMGKASITNSRLPAMPQPIKPTSPTNLNTGSVKIGSSNKISNNNMGAVLLDSLQQQIDVLRDYYESLPTRDDIEVIESALERDYAKKDDFNSLQFAVRDENVTYSIDEGKTWNTVAPVSTFAGEDGESAYETWKKQPGNSTKTEEEFLAAIKGDTGEAGATGADGKDACVPEYTSVFDANGNTMVTVRCTDEPTKVLGEYTVARGTDGRSPCDELKLEKDETHTEPGSTRYNLICVTAD